MPDQFERHSRSSDNDWGRSPSRSQQRRLAANDDPLHVSSPGRKDPERCKANKGGPHDVILAVEKPLWRSDICGWQMAWSSKQHGYAPFYICNHNRVCRYCGKRYGAVKNADCPLYDSEPPEGLAEQCETATQAALARRAKWRRRPVTGPTHYRKPKAE